MLYYLVLRYLPMLAASMKRINVHTFYYLKTRLMRVESRQNRLIAPITSSCIYPIYSRTDVGHQMGV